MGGNKMVRRRLLGAVALGMTMMSTPAWAEPTARRFDLAAQDLGEALRSVARQTGREVMVAADSVKGRRSPELHGDYTADQAIEALLLGSGLVVETREGVLYVRGRSEASPDTGGPTDGPQIVVTGSRIRGADSPSPIVVVTNLQMRNAGQNSIGDVIRSLPQNFGGGQNPGIGQNVPIATGNDTAGATSLNLRGLGPDATLTLLNGHRIAYGSNSQSIDVSAIPLAAVERIEILTDGASALYGSDAVAGVANIILKRDIDGLDTSAQFGAATDGGYKQQRYNALAGTTWATGGLFATYDFARTTAIVARQRDYAAARAPGLVLYPFQRQHNVLVSGHQDVFDGVTLGFDATFSRRFSNKSYALSAAANATRYFAPSWAHIFSVAPRADVDLPAGWRGSIQGVYGTDKSYLESLNNGSGVVTRTLRGCLCNRSTSAEISADGPLFMIGDREAKLAIGGGYRANHYRSLYTPAGIGPDVSKTQDAYYGFGELNLPLVGPSSGIGWIERFDLNAALRFEDYPGIDRVATPKVGAIYSPSPDIDLKGTWGKSFKAPTLYQRYADRYAILYTAVSRGGTGFPPGATVIYQTGSNPDLKPERATTWTASVAAHPRALPGLDVELTYFNIRYRDRVVTPIPFASQALAALYADYVTLAPSDAAKADALAGRGFFNLVGGTYNPASVVAIIANSSINAARQTIRGVDMSARYRLELDEAQSATFGVNASYLDSDQRLTPAQADLPLAGTLFNPPHWRVRADAGWTKDVLTLSSFVTYIGGVDDTRLAQTRRVGDMLTADVVARLVLPKGNGPLSGLDITLSVQNAFNAKPDTIRTTAVYDTPYDSTNYSPIGRFVSLAITRHW